MPNANPIIIVTEELDEDAERLFRHLIGNATHPEVVLRSTAAATANPWQGKMNFRGREDDLPVEQ